MSLRSSLQADLVSCMHRFNRELRQVEDRVDHIEHKMGEFATTINDLVDASEEKDEDMEWVKAKLADIEDRSRRNNLKIRGIPESVVQADLSTYINTMFKTLLPEATDMDITVDRVHRLPKPSHLPDHIPRDVILRVHFYHIKEKLMLSMRKKGQIPSQYADLQLYADLSQYTLMKRRNLNTVTKALRNHEISYRWNYPSKLTVIKDGTSHMIDSVDRGIALLRSWNILPDESSRHGTTKRPDGVDSVWKVVTHKNATKHV